MPQLPRTAPPPPTPTVALPPGYRWVNVNGRYVAQPLPKTGPPVPSALNPANSGGSNPARRVAIQTGTQSSGFGKTEPSYTTVTAGTRADDRASFGAGATTPAPAPKPTPKKQGGGTNVTGMQQFLAKQGYNIAVDGQNGPITQAAAADFRGSRNPHAFNVGHGLIHDNAPAPPPPGNGGAPPPAPTPQQKPMPNGKLQRSDHRFLSGGTASGASTTLPNSDLAQAKAYVDALINPVIKQIQDAAAARSAQGQQAIQGYTSAEQKLLGTYVPQAAAEYGGAMQSQNAIDTALSQRLTGQGADLSNALGAKLAQISADPATAARVGGDFSGAVSGAANANYAQGSATLSALGQQGAAAQDYTRAQPGIAGLAGIQSSKALQGQINSDTTTQLGAVAAKVPGLVQGILGQISGAHAAERKNQVAALIAAGRMDEALKVAQMNNDTRVSIANANNATRASVTDANNATKLQIAAAKAAGIPAKGKLTDSQLSKLVDSWKNGKVQNANVLQPNPDGNGNPVYKSVSGTTGTLNYGQAYSRLRTFGKTDQQARALLNTAYARGEQGRSWVSNEQQATLSKAGLPSKATVINKHGVLNPAQYKALKAAGDLPPGTLSAEGAYVIAPGY